MPSRWLVACAIDLLLDERKSLVESMLSSDDFFMLWVKSLFNQNHGQDWLGDKIKGVKHHPDIKTKLFKISSTNR
ncbi:hypothetical protein [Legionella sp. 16cNR16C]|uniref:hypothetical protein n=1 Tax=Legionella sp. 16cNR16C TaxID=2905656 RepID=UPI001E5F6B4A|nr:hypothetical protein [Legionella sp. 16cNR16C]MCE3043472.1 hypothetical protein [Legionella sp. 16cNR16C]